MLSFGIECQFLLEIGHPYLQKLVHLTPATLTVNVESELYKNVTRMMGQDYTMKTTM